MIFLFGILVVEER